MVSISLDKLKQAALFNAVSSTFKRVMEFSERGYSILFHTSEHGCSVVVSNHYVGQGFTFYFKDQVEMMTWAAGAETKPFRIKKSFFMSSSLEQQESDITELEAFEVLLPKREQKSVLGRFIDVE